MPLIKLSSVERRKLSIFFTCLLLATAAWLFFALSKNYEYTVKSNVNFSSPPVNKAFNPLQSDTVILTIKGTGWQLLFTKLRLYPSVVKVNLSQLNKRNYVTFTDQIQAINKQYSKDQKIISVQPDTLYFDFTTRKVKRVPLRLVSDLSFVKQYGQANATVLKPDYVTITGPQDELDKLSFWQTDTLKLDKLNSNISNSIALKNPLETNISIFPKQTEVKIEVEEFTEKRLYVPLKVINNNSYYNIKIIPDKVMVVIMVPLSIYSKVNESDFNAIIDFNLWRNHKLTQLPIKIIKEVPYVRLRMVIPNQADIIIKK
jgi:YbbR domain-containing protein